ncbi:hypothetical protein DX130_16725 [Paenibacillus paeoniae]|uniref:Uncharacterized protein n=1 Tax=Paenibacillus paeoniae TaxID=2292705 RepID=A0A371PFK8_9BACL|nr:hypothetical protein DX130_16725 [Paenibacillus paeoniae]
MGFFKLKFTYLLPITTVITMIIVIIAVIINQEDFSIRRMNLYFNAFACSQLDFMLLNAIIPFENYFSVSSWDNSLSLLNREIAKSRILLLIT